MGRLRILDLTRPLEPGPPSYPGDPATRFRVVARRDVDGYFLREACHSEHAGTHIDAPAHFAPDGVTVDRIPLDRLVLPGVVVDARGQERITGDLIDQQGIDVAGRAVVVVTGWRGKGPWPLIDESLAERLVEGGAGLLAVDTPSPDVEPWPVHRILLGSGIPIVENLCCSERLVGREGFILVVAPIPYRDGSGAPARVYAILDWNGPGTVVGK